MAVGASRRQISGVCLGTKWDLVQTLAVILTSRKGSLAVCIDSKAKHDIFAAAFRRSVNERVEKLAEPLLKLWGQDIFVLAHLQTHYQDVTAFKKKAFFRSIRRLVGNVLFTGPTRLPINRKKVKEKRKTQEPISLHELFNTEWPLLLRADGEVC